MSTTSLYFSPASVHCQPCLACLMPPYLLWRHSTTMFIARRVATRASVLVTNWIHHNAFVLGILAGFAVTLGIVLIH